MNRRARRENGSVTFLDRSQEDDEADEQLWLFAGDQLSETLSPTTNLPTLINHDRSPKNQNGKDLTGSPRPANSDECTVHSNQAQSEFVGRGAGGEGIQAWHLQIGISK
jgi:hypothetical protein